MHLMGFLGGSGGKESACNAGDWGLIPGSGRSTGEGNGYPLQYSCLENPRDRGAWWAAIYGVTQSRTQLKWLSRSSSNVWRREWWPTPVLLPGKSHGWRSLVGYSPWGHEESHPTEQLHFHFSLSCIGEGNGNPLQCSCLENPRDRAAWWVAIYGVTQNRTQLMWFSSSRSSIMQHKFSLYMWYACIKIYRLGTFLVIQWLGLCTFTATALVQSLVKELKSHKHCVVAKRNRSLID